MPATKPAKKLAEYFSDDTWKSLITCVECVSPQPASLGEVVTAAKVLPNNVSTLKPKFTAISRTDLSTWIKENGKTVDIVKSEVAAAGPNNTLSDRALARILKYRLLLLRQEEAAEASKGKPSKDLKKSPTKPEFEQVLEKPATNSVKREKLRDKMPLADLEEALNSVALPGTSDDNMPSKEMGGVDFYTLLVDLSTPELLEELETINVKPDLIVSIRLIQQATSDATLQGQHVSRENCIVKRLEIPPGMDPNLLFEMIVKSSFEAIELKRAYADFARKIRQIEVPVDRVPFGEETYAGVIDKDVGGTGVVPVEARLCALISELNSDAATKELKRPDLDLERISAYFDKKTRILNASFPTSAGITAKAPDGTVKTSIIVDPEDESRDFLTLNPDMSHVIELVGRRSDVFLRLFRGLETTFIGGADKMKQRQILSQCEIDVEPALHYHLLASLKDLGFAGVDGLRWKEEMTSDLIQKRLDYLQSHSFTLTQTYNETLDALILVFDQSPAVQKVYVDTFTYKYPKLVGIGAFADESDKSKFSSYSYTNLPAPQISRTRKELVTKSGNIVTCQDGRLRLETALFHVSAWEGNATFSFRYWPFLFVTVGRTRYGDGEFSIIVQTGKQEVSVSAKGCRLSTPDNEYTIRKDGSLLLKESVVFTPSEVDFEKLQQDKDNVVWTFYPLEQKSIATRRDNFSEIEVYKNGETVTLKHAALDVSIRKQRTRDGSGDEIVYELGGLPTVLFTGGEMSVLFEDVTATGSFDGCSSFDMFSGNGPNFKVSAAGLLELSGDITVDLKECCIEIKGEVIAKASGEFQLFGTESAEVSCNEQQKRIDSLEELFQLGNAAVAPYVLVLERDATGYEVIPDSRVIPYLRCLSNSKNYQVHQDVGVDYLEVVSSTKVGQGFMEFIKRKHMKRLRYPTAKEPRIKPSEVLTMVRADDLELAPKKNFSPSEVKQLIPPPAVSKPKLLTKIPPYFDSAAGQAFLQSDQATSTYRSRPAVKPSREQPTQDSDDSESDLEPQPELQQTSTLPEIPSPARESLESIAELKKKSRIVETDIYGKPRVTSLPALPRAIQHVATSAERNASYLGTEQDAMKRLKTCSTATKSMIASCLDVYPTTIKFETGDSAAVVVLTNVGIEPIRFKLTCPSWVYVKTVSGPIAPGMSVKLHVSKSGKPQESDRPSAVDEVKITTPWEILHLKLER